MDWLQFLGRFHVLALHLPIGILVLAALTELVYAWRPAITRPAIVNAMWWSGALSAIIASGLGYMLSLSSGYNEDAVDLHLIWGIATSLIAVIGWWVIGFKARRGKALVTLISGGQLVALSIAGHLGGNLTHGPEYLFEHAPNSVRALAGFAPKQAPRPPVEDLAQADIFLDVVQPLMELRCTSCHNPSKTKGKLLLDTYAHIMAGGESGASVIPGDVAASDLSVRINHDPEHDDFMPSGGRTPLTMEQTLVIDWWIEVGAPESGTLDSFGLTPELRSLFAAAIGTEEPASDKTFQSTNALGLPRLPAISKDLIMELERLGFDATPIAEDINYLDIDFYRLGSGAISDEHVAALLKAKDHIAWLNLGNSGLQNAQLTTLAQLPNLLKLDISKNNLTDDGIASLTPLSQLQNINLHDTDITDGALPVLDKLPALKNAYLWSTAVTAAATADREYAQTGVGFAVVPSEEDESNK
ncbi:MAG: ribonuclease inhibitor [Synoicihabitans sp.]